MEILAKILVGIVAFEHLCFFWLEALAWETAGKKAFKGSLPDELFKPTKTLAANQGLYNSFLAAGLIWTYFIKDANWATNIAIFFLACVLVAAIFGAITASKKILFIQGIPAALALGVTLLNYLS